jgi:hypothetical protein
MIFAMASSISDELRRTRYCGDLDVKRIVLLEALLERTGMFGL